MGSMTQGCKTSKVKTKEESFTQISTIRKTDTSIIQTVRETTLIKTTETSITPNSKRRSGIGGLLRGFKLKLIDYLEIIKLLFF